MRNLLVIALIAATLGGVIGAGLVTVISRAHATHSEAERPVSTSDYAVWWCPVGVGDSYCLPEGRQPPKGATDDEQRRWVDAAPRLAAAGCDESLMMKAAGGVAAGHCVQTRLVVCSSRDPKLTTITSSRDIQLCHLSRKLCEEDRKAWHEAQPQEPELYCAPYFDGERIE